MKSHSFDANYVLHCLMGNSSAGHFTYSKFPRYLDPIVLVSAVTLSFDRFPSHTLVRLEAQTRPF